MRCMQSPASSFAAMVFTHRPWRRSELLRQAPQNLSIFQAHRTRHEVFAMQKMIYSSLIFIVVAAVCSHLAADDGGWKMPNLNPFSGSGHPRTSSGAGQPPTSGWKMPKLLPQASAQPKQRAGQPKTGNRSTNSTTNVFSKTAAALNPWDKKQPTPPPKLTGSNSIFTNKSTT